MRRGPDRRAYLVRTLRLVGYLAGAILIVDVTTNLGGLDRIGSWWSEPITYQKLAIWTLLWELVGFGGSPALARLHLRPPIGGALYWLQPETMRLPPWPARIPLTAGTRRQAGDVTLYLVALGAGVVLLCSGSTHGVAFDTLPSWPLWVLLLALAALGLRDRTVLLAARPERFAVLLVVFLFPPSGLVFALKLVLVAAWWTAAPSLDLRSDPRLTWTARAALVAAPLVLLVTRGGALTIAALVVVLIVEALGVAADPLQAEIELHAFTAYSALVLFGQFAAVGTAGFHSLLLGLLLALLLAGVPALAVLRPDVLSLTPAQSIWLFQAGGAEERFDSSLVKPMRPVTAQLARRVGRGGVEPALRAELPRSSALAGLLPLAVPDPGDRAQRDGALIAGVALGWGADRLPVDQLLAAIQFECDFAPGQLRVVTVRTRWWRSAGLDYRILDAADGLLERGTVTAVEPVRVRVTFQAGRPVPAAPAPVAPALGSDPVAAPVTALPVPPPRPRPSPGPGRPHPARIA